MNLNEYIKMKQDEIKFLFRRINFENIGTNEQLVKQYLYIGEEEKNINIINKNKDYRKLANEILLNIHNLLFELEKDLNNISMESTKIYLSNLISEEEKNNLINSSLKNSVDILISNFFDKVINELELMRTKVLEKYYSENNIPKKNQTYLTNKIPKLDIFGIKVGNQIYKANKNKTKKNNNQNLETIDDFRVILVYLYSIPNLLNEQINTNRELNDLNTYRTEFKDFIIYELGPRYETYYPTGTNNYINLMQNYYAPLLRPMPNSKLKKLYENLENFILETTGKKIKELINEIDLEPKNRNTNKRH